MHLLKTILVSVICSFISTIAFSQIINFTKSGKQLIRFDKLGNAVDAHDGEIAYFNGVYYLYGTSYDCGYEWGNKSAPFCGFKVYTSTNLSDWDDKGYLFDAATQVWQSRCNGGTYGCYRPHVIYNKKTSLYVLWINVYDNRVGYRVFTSKNPGGPFTEAAEPTLAVNSNMPIAGLNNGDHDTFTDDDGTAYLAYTDWRAKGAIVIEKLSDDYLTGTGEHVASVTKGETEAPCLFKRNGRYYLIYSDPNCGYCSGTGSSYKSSSSPLGPWSDALSISNNSCGGQPSFVSVIKVNAETVYLYGSDLWNNAAKNEALANYYWAPLSFDASGNIEPLKCMDSYHFYTGKKPAMGTSDGWQIKRNFNNITYLTKDTQYAQSFIIPKTGKLDSIAIALFQLGNPNNGLTIELYKTSSKGLPLHAPLYTTILSPASVGWSLKSSIFFPGLPVRKGEAYTMLLHTNATAGRYGLAYGDSVLHAESKAVLLNQGQSSSGKALAGSLKFQVFVN